MASACGLLHSSGVGRGIRRFNDLRAWQVCVAYKQAVYEMCADGPLSRDWSRRRQLEESVAGPPAHLAEGFGRFSPAEFSRFLVIARSSIIESQNHLRDAVDTRYITEETRQQMDEFAAAALREITGLMEYLQSAELRNPRRAREQRIATRHARRATRNEEP